MKKVKSANVQTSYPRQVPECLGNTVIFLVDNKGPFPHGVTSVPDLTNTSPNLKQERDES